MINIIQSVVLIILFLTTAGVSEHFILNRMSGRRISGIRGLTIEIRNALFAKYTFTEYLIISAYIAVALLNSSHNNLFLPNVKCMELLFALILLPFCYGYLVYGKSKMIESRRFNINMLIFLSNGLVFSSITALFLNTHGLDYISSAVFIQQNGYSSWFVSQDPLNFALSAISIFAFAGFSPFGGISYENDFQLAYEEKTTEGLLWLLSRLFRYSLFVFFTNLFLGGASGIFQMLVKLIIINTFYTMVSSLFPKMRIRENFTFNLAMLLILMISFLTYGGIF
ncbi:MAG: hypothetical protein AB7T10_05770 [bacterium]